MTRLTRRGRRMVDALRAWARGHGEILFCESPVGGVLILLGLVPLSPRGALLSALACAIATGVARAGGFPRPEWRRGLYGYVGALVGIFWGVLFAPTLATHVTFVMAALAAAPLTRLAHRLLTPRGIPALAVPALAMVSIAAPFLPYAEPGAAPGLAPEAAGWALTLVGLAVGSWMLAAAAIVGGIAGGLASYAIAGGIDGGIVGNAVPTAIALGAVFMPWSLGSMIVAALGAAAAGAAWWYAAPWTAAVGVPALVWPFAL
ncbi:MAG TPA: urea transporter, partial [Terriglobales bacterium]|nr:urea transporter [Terriglobales bacterium]